MKIREVLFCIVIILIASPSWADDVDVTSKCPDSEAKKAYMMPASIEQFLQSAEDEVKKNNDAESQDRKIELIKYNEDGTINTVEYKDGQIVNYSYEFDDKGELSDCKLTSATDTRSTSIEFSNTEKGSQIRVYAKTSSDESKTVREEGARADEPITIILPEKTNLDRLSRKPVKFDFTAIGNTIDDVSAQKQAAYKDYVKNTEPYYTEISKELSNKFDLLKSEGIKLNDDLKGLEHKMISESRREIIDNAVTYIISESAKDRDGRPDMADFLATEKNYRTAFLDPSKIIYDEKMQKAMEYINVIIDKLINSKIAVYLDKDGDKIDAIINLPVNPKNEE